jgi:hypothetical protein
MWVSNTLFASLSPLHFRVITQPVSAREQVVQAAN